MPPIVLQTIREILWGKDLDTKKEKVYLRHFILINN